MTIANPANPAASTLTFDSAWQSIGKLENGHVVSVLSAGGIFLVAAGAAKIVALAITVAAFVATGALFYVAAHQLEALPQEFHLFDHSEYDEILDKVKRAAHEMWIHPELSATLAGVATCLVVGLPAALLVAAGFYGARYAEKHLRNYSP